MFGSSKKDEFRALGPHVTAYYTGTYPLSNAAIVRGADATLVFDATLLRYARLLRRAVEESGPPLRELVLSHAHNDHVHGAMHFVPPARGWARRFVANRLAYWSTRDLSPFAQELAAFNPDLAGEYSEVRIVVPEEVVERERSIELGGGVRVGLYPEALAHTPGDLWAFVEPDGVALCGDLWFSGFEPYLGSGSAAGSLAALRHLRAVGAHTYLPGHGPAGVIGPEGTEMMARYCQWVEQRTADGLGRGLRGEALRAAVRAEYALQRDAGNGIRFALEWPMFLEDAVEAIEKEQLSAWV